MRALHLVSKSLDAARSLISQRRLARGSAAQRALHSHSPLTSAAKGLASANVLTGVKDSALVRSLLLRRFPQTIGVASTLILLSAVCWKVTQGKSVPHRATDLAPERARTAHRLRRGSRRSGSGLQRSAGILEVSPIHKEEQVMAARKGRHEYGKSVNAVTLLKQDHDEVSALLKEFESADRAGKASIAERICAALTVHAQIEEQIFYPAARGVLDDDDMDLVDEADIEHATIKGLVKRLQTAGPSDDHFEALMTVLGEYVKHHVKEEEKQLFPKVRRTNLDLEALGQQLAALKNQLKTSTDVAHAS